MTKYERLIDIAFNAGLNVHEDVEFKSPVNGLIVGRNIALSEGLDNTDKNCVLAEEIAHHYINEGNIINDCYQETKAHRYAIDLILSVESVINTIIDLREDATIATVAEKLEVSESFLKESLTLYSRRFDGQFEYNGYCISFNPVHVWKKEQ